jgi:hypothetical protein
MHGVVAHQTESIFRVSKYARSLRVADRDSIYMRKTIVIGFIVLGAAIGGAAGLGESIGLKLLFGCIGAIAGAAIGGALAGIGRRQRVSEEAGVQGLTDSQNARRKNYWLDRGRLTSSPGLPHPDDLDPHSREP